MHIKELGNKILSRKVLMLVIVSIIICAFMLVVGENAFAKCEAALKRLQAAEDIPAICILIWQQYMRELGLLMGKKAQ